MQHVPVVSGRHAILKFVDDRHAAIPLVMMTTPSPLHARDQPALEAPVASRPKQGMVGHQRPGYTISALCAQSPSEHAAEDFSLNPARKTGRSLERRPPNARRAAPPRDAIWWTVARDPEARPTNETESAWSLPLDQSAEAACARKRFPTKAFDHPQRCQASWLRISRANRKRPLSPQRSQCRSPRAQVESPASF